MKDRVLRELFENWTTEELDTLLVYILQEDHHAGKERLFLGILSILREREATKRKQKNSRKHLPDPGKSENGQGCLK